MSLWEILETRVYLQEGRRRGLEEGMRVALVHASISTARPCAWKFMQLASITRCHDLHLPIEAVETHTAQGQV